MPPLVSIVMPVYNCEKYVAEGIRSVLAQTYSPIELICVNDASTDGSLEVLRSFGDKITIINLPKNKGIAGGRNAGIKVARGEFLSFADGDDILKPEKVAMQVEQLRTNPELDMSFCMIENFISPELPESVRASRRFTEGPISGTISGGFLAKRSSFDQVGLLNEDYRVGEFIDWMARATNLGLKHDMIDQVLYLRRIHETNTVSNRPAQTDYLKMIKAAIDRKRAA